MMRLLMIVEELDREIVEEESVEALTELSKKVREDSRRIDDEVADEMVNPEGITVPDVADATDQITPTKTQKEMLEDDDCQFLGVTTSKSKKRKATPIIPLRTQPLRAGKITSSYEKGEGSKSVKSSAKRARMTKVTVSNKELLMELECSERFLTNEGLLEIFELIKFQEWEKLCETQVFVSAGLVNEFYRDMTLVDGKIPYIKVDFRGHELRVSSADLASILNIPHTGYDQFNKGTWPEEAESRKSLVKKICGLNSVEKGGQISTQMMEPKTKILHKLLVTNFVQRGTKPSYCQHEDLLLLDKILKKEKINLPKLIIYQMNHMKDLTKLGFARIIKRILEEHDLYEIGSEVEDPVVRPFNSGVFKKMNLMRNKDLGWIRATASKSKEPKIKMFQEPDLDEEEDSDEDSDFEMESDLCERVIAMEEGIAGLKSDIYRIKYELIYLNEKMDLLMDGLGTVINKLKDLSP